jgi:CRISPR-associated protein Csb1
MTQETLDAWADDSRGPVALHLKQTLLPVEGPGAVIFPPTYAKTSNTAPPYAIDTLSDGTKLVQIDSVGAQANRIEPLFAKARDGAPDNPLAALVPQVDIVIDAHRRLSILEAGHRLGDALIRSTDLAEDAQAAFRSLLDNGDVAPIARLAPTSLVFGAWDSRDTQAKLPRIVQATVRGWDIDDLKRSAQYVPPVNYAELGVVSEDAKSKAEEAAQSGPTKNPLAQRGFVHVPAVDMPGGVVVHGKIVRDVTINLVALRQLDGENGVALRCYILGLALVAAAEPPDPFLRQGCLLTLDPDAPAVWQLVGRDGRRSPVDLTPKNALAYARVAAGRFGVGPDRTVTFSKERAKADLNEDKKPRKVS